jgi:hypothetical protein
MLTLYRRHLKSCEHRGEGRKYRRCRCPIWVDGQLGGGEIARSLRMRDWQKANQLIQDWEARNEQTQPSVLEPMTLPQAWDTFLGDAEARNLREPSLRKYRYLRRRWKSSPSIGARATLNNSISKPCWRSAPLGVTKIFPRLKARDGALLLPICAR